MLKWIWKKIENNIFFYNIIFITFQSNKTATVNDHTTIVKKPLGPKAPYNNSGNISRDLRESSGINTIERETRDHRDRERERDRSGIRDINSVQKLGHNTGQLKRSPSFSPSVTAGNSHHIQHGPPPLKKHKVSSMRECVTIAEAGKYGSLNDYAFFDKVFLIFNFYNNNESKIK